ncbi:MAG: hypothetical protein KDK11_05355 [Maritimibacter sp.]|nr:hypothetical protein [Maritimibacter sp.]
MKTSATAALAAIAASPALAHADGSAHLHGTDAAVWLALAVVGGIASLFLFGR